MIIRNKSKNRMINKDAKLCKSIASQSLGLIFSKPKSLVFEFEKEKIISLHMLFVFYPIDVLFLDKSKIVVDKKENFSPFTFYTSKKKAMYAIEMANKTIKKTETELGDKIEFK